MWTTALWCGPKAEDTRTDVTRTASIIYPINAEGDDEICRPLVKRISEHQIAEQVFEEQQHIFWHIGSPVCFEQHWLKRKFKESVYMVTSDNSISKPNVEIPKLWDELVRSEIASSHPAVGTLNRRSGEEKKILIHVLRKMCR